MDKTPYDIKVLLALVCMEGPVLYWIHWILQCTPRLTWKQLSIKLLQRYGCSYMMSLYEQLKTIKQEGNVDEYIDDFVSKAG